MSFLPPHTKVESPKRGWLSTPLNIVTRLEIAKERRDIRPQW
jgi:hypothetical protein